MKAKKVAYKPDFKLIATGFFASTACWFFVDNYILKVSIVKYISIEVVMGIMGALYEFEKRRLKKKHFNSDKSKQKFD